MSNEAKLAGIRKEVSHRLKNGQTIQLGQLGLKDFQQCKEEALQQFRRDMIEAVSKNADLLPPDMAERKLEEVLEKAKATTYGDLPQKPAKVPLYNKETGLFLKDEQGEIQTEVRDLPYEQWWTSETPEGMLYAIWLSIRRCTGQEHYTLDDVDDIFMESLPDLENAAQSVGEMSVSHLAKNSESPEATGVANGEAAK